MTQWYDRIASAYDCHPMPLSTRLAEALVRQAAISAGEWVLDVGTGTGNVALAAARCVGARGRVIGIDLSRAMLGEARRRAGDLPVEFQEMDAEALQFGDATFDAALGGLLPEVVPAIGEMHRVLRPGGRAAFSTYTRETLQPLADVTWSRLERHRIPRPPAPPEPWTASRESEQLLLLLEKAGFQEVQVVPELHIHTLQSAEDWWTYMRRSTRWGALLDQFSAEALEDLKAEILEDVERLRTKEGIQVDTSALIGIGVRRQKQAKVTGQPEAKMSRGVALTLKELVVDHVHTTLEPEDWQWQPPLKRALEGLTAAQAAWKPTPERHSIWQIVRHLILWKRAVLDAWDGNPPDPKQLPASDWQEVAGSEADWERDRRTLLEISTQFLTRAQALDDAELSKQIVWYKGWPRTQPLAMRLVRTTTHDIYHAGQIRYLRALQGIPGRREP